MKIKLLLIAGKNANLSVFGIPAIRRLVLLAQKLGIQDIFCFFMPRYADRRKIISDFIPDDHFIPATELVNLGELLLESWFQDDSDVIILTGNQVIDKLSFQKLINEDSDQIVSLVDPSKIGSDLAAIKVPGNIPDKIETLYTLLRSITLSGELPNDIRRKVKKVNGSPGLPYPLTDNAMSVKEAEKRLMDSLGLQTAETDGFMARNFDRHISRFFSKRLVRTGLHPNWFTVMGMSIGLLGAWFLSQPHYICRLIGSLLFVFCIMVDGVDGEIARLTLKDSTFGHYFDVVTDNIVHAAIFIALPVSFYRETGNAIYLKALWLLLAGVALAAFSAYYCIFRVEQRYSERILVVFDKLASRDFAYLIAFLAMIDRLQWFLWGATFGSYAFALALWTLYLRSSSLTRGCYTV